jgi:hypothetical protein
MSWRRLIQENEGERLGRAWFEHASHELQAHAGKKYLPYALIGSKAPEFLALDFLDPFIRIPNILFVMTRVPPSDDASTDRRIIDSDGQLVPVQARLLVLDSAVDAFRAGRASAWQAALQVEGTRLCVNAETGGSVTLVLPAAVSGPTLVAELTFETTEDRIVTIATAAAGKWWFSPVTTTLRADQGHALFWLDTKSVEVIAIASLPSGRLCLDSVAVAIPHYPPDSRNVCAVVDSHGLRGAPVPCGGPWVPLAR